MSSTSSPPTTPTPTPTMYNDRIANEMPYEEYMVTNGKGYTPNQRLKILNSAASALALTSPNKLTDSPNTNITPTQQSRTIFKNQDFNNISSSYMKKVLTPYTKLCDEGGVILDSIFNIRSQILLLMKANKAFDNGGNDNGDDFGYSLNNDRPLTYTIHGIKHPPHTSLLQTDIAKALTSNILKNENNVRGLRGVVRDMQEVCERGSRMVGGYFEYIYSSGNEELLYDGGGSGSEREGVMDKHGLLCEEVFWRSGVMEVVLGVASDGEDGENGGKGENGSGSDESGDSGESEWIERVKWGIEKWNC